MEPIIQVKDLSKRFGEDDLNCVKALEHINLDIYPGEIFGIIGLSGAGKSTLVRCMNLLERPTEGSITVDGNDLMQLSEKELRQARKSIGMIFQHFNLLMQRTCLDNITFPLELIGTPRKKAVERARELLKIVDLEEKENAYPAQLSGGQKQRIAIARAVLRNPGILLLDEATSALDTVSEKLVQQALDSLMKNRTTIIIAHRLSTIRNADKIVVLKDGRISQLGTHDELMAQEGTYKELYETQRKAATEESQDAGGVHQQEDSIFYRQHPRALELERKKR